jgi:hypothetical protein
MKKRIFLSFILLTPFIVFLLGSIDTGLKEDSHLGPKNLIKYSEDINGASFLLRGLAVISDRGLEESEIEILRERHFIPDAVEVFLEKYADVIDLLEQGSKTKSFYVPIDYPFDPDYQYPLGKLILASRLLTLKSEWSASIQDWQSCVTTLKVINSYALIIEKAHPMIATAILSSMLKFSYIETVYRVLNKYPIPDNFYQELVEPLKGWNFENLYSVYDEAIKSKYQREKSIILGAETNYSFHRFRTCNIAISNCNELLGISGLRPIEASIALGQWEKRVRSKFDFYTSPLVPNNQGYEITAGAYTRGLLYSYLHRTVVLRDLCFLSMYLSKFEKKNDRLPNSLLEIYDEYDLNIYDHFAVVSKTPYKYSMERRLIWSVGIDFTDNQGDFDRDSHEQDSLILCRSDIIIRIGNIKRYK